MPPQNAQQVNPQQTQPINVPTPTVFASSPATSDQSVKKPSSLGKIVKIFLIFFFVFIILTAGAGGAAAAIAYEKFTINNPAIERPLTHFVLGLPFAPKTPKYVLEASAKSHAAVSKHAFDVSLAAKSDDFTNSLGLNQIDVEAKGDVDYEDPANLKLNLNASITKEFNVDLKKADSIVYFRINKFPSFLLKFMKIDEAKIKPVMENWVSYDTKPLMTEARKELDERSPQQSITKEYITNLIQDLLDEKLLPNLQMSKENLEGKAVHKIHLVADARTIDNLVYRIQNRVEGKDQNDLRLSEGESKPSDVIKDLEIDLWAGENDYFVRKVVTSFTLKPETGIYDSNTTSKVLGAATFDVLGLEDSLFPVQASETSIVMAVKFDKFGNSFTVDKPDKSLSLEDYYMKLAEASGMFDDSGGPGELTTRSRDAARFTDLAVLQQAINVSMQESESQNILCEGDNDKKAPCSGSSMGGARTSDGSGWIKLNLQSQKSVSIPTLPVDPTNNQFHHYVYCSNGTDWEINAVLESEQQISKMETDGGDDPAKYEVGSNLTLVGKTSGCKY